MTWDLGREREKNKKFVCVSYNRKQRKCWGSVYDRIRFLFVFRVWREILEVMWFDFDDWELEKFYIYSYCVPIIYNICNRQSLSINQVTPSPVCKVTRLDTSTTFSYQFLLFFSYKILLKFVIHSGGDFILYCYKFKMFYSHV